MHFLLKVRTKASDLEMVNHVRSHGIRISCLSEYQHGDTRTDSGTIVINYSGLDYDRAAEAVKTLLSYI